MAFTTWAAHAANLRNDLATNSWRRKSYTLPDGVDVMTFEAQLHVYDDARNGSHDLVRITVGRGHP